MLRDHVAPERGRGRVLRPLTNLPTSFEPIEQRTGCLATDALPSVAAHDEELGHVEHAARTAQPAARAHERKPAWASVDPEQEWVRSVVPPVRLQLPLPETTVFRDVQ